MARGLEVAKAEIAKLIALQDEFIAEAGVTEMEWVPTPAYGEDIWAALWSAFAGKLEAAIVPDKHARDEAFGAVKEEAKAHLEETLPDGLEGRGTEFSAAWKSLQKKVMRRRVLDQGVRLDGRGATEIRPLSAEIGLVPRAHGSALFNRGETQVLNVTTLGMLRMTQMIDTLDPEDTKRYIHHYNFPPYSTGETGRVGSPRRREIGHGALAERALIPVVPNEDDFPYALRLVSDVMSSNGSTSMASVCGSTLSMMDAGVPLKAPVAGIAMGMIADDGQVRDAHRHPRRRGRTRRHGLQGRRYRGVRHRDPARHEGPGHAGRGSRRGAAAGEGRAPQDPGRDARRHPGAALGSERERTARSSRSRSRWTRSAK